MRNKKLLIAVFLPLFLLGIALFFQNEISDLYSGFFLRLQSLQIEEKLTDSLKEKTERKIIIPEPLEAKEKYPEAFLTEEGIIVWTNIQRERYDLSPLEENPLLDDTAQAKLEDMFSNQYFAHQSPAGFEIGDLAEDFGYEFIVIGENLAMGDFENDQSLVQGWMDSPGHRENILNDQYQEIGVAVGKGTFDGNSTWLAVQHFALSLSSCPQVDAALKGKIEDNQNQIDGLLVSINEMEKELKFKGRRNIIAYRREIDEYNDLVSRYNGLVEETKVLINQYNYQVELFNSCVSGIE